MDRNTVVLPEGDDIQSLSDQDLQSFEATALAEIEALFQADNVDADSVALGQALASDIERVRAESARRVAAAAESQVDLAAERDAILARVRPAEAATAETVAATGETQVAAEAKPQGGVKTALRAFGGLAGPKQSLNPELRGQTKTPTNSALGVDLAKAQSFSKVSEAEERPTSVLTASADIPGFTQGGRIDTMAQLVKAMQQRAKRLPVANGNGQRQIVASLQREYTYTFDQHMNLDEMSALLELATNPQALIAAGGWCAPGEISYDFYNIVCIDGLIDLPTVGLNRGSLSWPVSPSFGDIQALPGVVWTWTNTMDIAAATGTAQSGVKPCVRVPCPSYTSGTAACDGLCVTVGNLTSDAFPELIANHLRLVEAIHAHYVNSRVIASMVAQSSAPVTTTGTDLPAAVASLNQLAFYRRHLIEKYSMCDDAVVEGVMPRWYQDQLRADLRYVAGVAPGETFNVSNATLADWLDTAGIRMQFVADWQVRGASGFPGSTAMPTAWPGTVSALLYPAGTFFRANGMDLDLGVVRDSTLNATNDYTAAWMEECWFVGKQGHESLNLTIDTCANGRRGALDVTGCNI